MMLRSVSLGSQYRSSPLVCSLLGLLQRGPVDRLSRPHTAEGGRQVEHPGGFLLHCLALS